MSHIVLCPHDASVLEIESLTAHSVTLRRYVCPNGDFVSAWISPNNEHVQVADNDENISRTAGTSVGYPHTQFTPSTVWTIQHNLGFEPGGIVVLDENNELVLGWTVSYSSLNVLILTFPTPQSGNAHVS